MVLPVVLPVVLAVSLKLELTVELMVEVLDLLPVLLSEVDTDDDIVVAMVVVPVLDIVRESDVVGDVDTEDEADEEAV